MSEILYSKFDETDLNVDPVDVNYSETISSRSESVKPACTGSFKSERGGGGGGRGGRGATATKSFHGLLGQVKEEALLGVNTMAVGCKGFESAVGFWLFVSVTVSVLPSWDSSDDSSFLCLTRKLWMFLSGLQPGGRLRVIMVWNQHFEKQDMR